MNSAMVEYWWQLRYCTCTLQ